MQSANQPLESSDNANMLTLFCLVDGEPTSNAFSVKVPAQDSVDDLKKLIKAAMTPTFDDVAANKLTLWRVSIPVVAAHKHKEITLDSLQSESKEELLPTGDLSEEFSDGAPKKTIHIIVHRTRPVSEISSLVVLKVILQTNPRQDFPWTTDAKTATLAELEQAIYDACPEIKDGPATIGIHRGKIHGIPELKIEYISTDVQLQRILWTDAEARIKTLKVVLEAPTKAFSKFTITKVNEIFNITDRPAPSWKDFPPFECMRSVSFDPDSNYSQRWGRLSGILEDQKNVIQVTNEAGKSAFVCSFLTQAILLFKDELLLIPERGVTGKWGHGPVDYAIESRKHAAFMLGVTEVKHDTLEKGVAQNVVQLDASLTDRKRKVVLPVDESIPLVSYGIVTNSAIWIFVECTMQRTTESGPLEPSFRMSRIPVFVDFELDNWRKYAKIVFGYIVWLIAKDRADRVEVRKGQGMETGR